MDTPDLEEAKAKYIHNMIKFLIYSITLILTANVNYAGHGAYVIADNATALPISLVNASSTCVNNVEALATNLGAVRAAKIYLETNDSGLCFFNRSIGTINLVYENIILGSISYVISAYGTEATVVANFRSDLFDLKAYSKNTFDRTKDQDLIVIKMLPKEASATKYSSWMHEVKNHIINQQLAKIILPGTHDSFSYDLSDILCTNNQLAIYNIPNYVMGFAKAQNLSFIAQLERGIRYFDVRLCYQKNINDEEAHDYTVHDLLSKANFFIYLQPLAQFLHDHPQEIIILDINHTYGYNELSFKNLLDKLKELYANNILSYQEANPTTTIASIWNLKKNLIIILPEMFNSLHNDPNYAFAWPSTAINSPWPNTTNENELLTYAKNELNNHDQTTLFVSQLQLTPDSNFIINNLATDLNYLADLYLTNTYNWLWENKNSGKLNIYIRDFSDGYDGAIFAQQNN